MNDAVLAIACPNPVRMDQVLDESIVKAKYVPREVPGYLKDFPVNKSVFDTDSGYIVNYSCHTQNSLQNIGSV